MLPRTPRPQVAAGGSYRASHELATLCFGAPTSFTESGSTYYYKNLQMLNKINPQIDKAVGDKLIGKYWSGYEWNEERGWHVDVTTPHYGVKPKTDTYKVRAVLAF